MAAPTLEVIVEVQARAIGLLNEVEALLCGPYLAHDREEVAKLTEPLYGLLDTDSPPSVSV